MHLVYDLTIYLLLLCILGSNNWYQSQKVYLVGKLAGKKGYWFEWEQWQKKESLGSRNLRAKIMEDVNGGLYVLEESIPTVGWKNKTTDEYEG